MIVIGSCASKNVRFGNPKDIDIVLEKEETAKYMSSFENISDLEYTDTYIHFFDGKIHHELYISTPGSSNEDILKYCNNVLHQKKNAPNDVLLMIKLSHRYKRNSKHFMKTMRDIKNLRRQGAVLNDELTTILKKREEETYTYSHPNLDSTKTEFFDKKTVGYVYDHDTIHEAVKILDRPAYSFYMKDGAQVQTSKEKFFDASYEVRLLGVYEESCVLALERSQIPTNFKASPEWSFKYALEKVCTSITSGWFREFAWENYDAVMKLYKEKGTKDYVERFHKNKNILKPFEENTYGS